MDVKPTAVKDFKLDGVLYKKGQPVDYLSWPRHTQFQLRGLLNFGTDHGNNKEILSPAKLVEYLKTEKKPFSLAGLKSKFFTKGKDAVKGE